jgi:hypothetical protein
MKRVDRIGDIVIGAVIGFIFAILLMLVLSGCVPGGAASPAQLPAGESLAFLLTRPVGKPSFSPDEPGGPLVENRTGRAAKKAVAVSSAMRLPRGADEKLAQARLARSSPPVRRALDMLRAHESVNGTRMVGDGGKARGWLQQHEDHWREGCAMLGVSWPWPEDTGDLAKCEAVAVGYWRRYAPDALAAGSVEELVRRFRLPNAPGREDNDAYWQRVKEIMQ